MALTIDQPVNLNSRFDCSKKFSLSLLKNQIFSGNQRLFASVAIT